MIKKLYDKPCITPHDCFTAMDEYAEQQAVDFAKWVRESFNLEKGKYRHRGDFYRNQKKLFNESEIYQLFLTE